MLKRSGWIFLVLVSVSAQAVESVSEKSCRVSSAEGEAASFRRAVDGLADVNSWGRRTIPGGAFILRDWSGQKVSRAAQIGDFIEIKLPADPSMRSYWVEIEQVQMHGDPEQGRAFFQVVVRPSARPTADDDRKIIDHFYTDDATNTFTVSLLNGQLTVRVQGSTEIPNMNFARNPIEAAQNAVIANSSWGVRMVESQAGFGPQRITWEMLEGSLARCE